MKSHRAKIALYKPEEASPVPIAGDAAIAQHGMGEGRMIPLLILDTTKRDDIDELIRIHEHLPPGDVNSQWGRIEHRRDRAISLILQFLRPSRATIIIEFDILRQGILVDQMLLSQGVFLQAGRPGDRFVNTLDAPRILVNVPKGEFTEIWDEMFQKRITVEMRERGLKRAEAKRASRQYIEELRKVSMLRIPS
jgi:hypothetical protein